MALFCSLLLISCSKQPLPGTSQTGSSSSYSGQVTITVTSNYLRSVLQVTNTTDNINILVWNYSGYDGDCPYTKSFTAQAGKSYKIYSYSTKNSADSTFAMSDNKPVWNSLQILNKAGQPLYAHKDSIGTGSWRICKNNFTLN